MDAIVVLNDFLQLVFGKKRIKNFEDKVFLNKSRMKNLDGYLLWSTIEGIILMICLMTFLFKINESFVESAIIFGGLSFFVPLLINYIFIDIIFEKRKRQREELLSDLLLEASVFCDDSSTQRTIKLISESDFPLLNEDFAFANTQIKNGASVEDALSRIKELNKSGTYSRVIDLFIQGYKSGAKISTILRETAEDLLESGAIIKERQAVMLVTKYTLLLSAGIIVPALLGLIVGLVEGLNFNSMGELGLGLSVSQRRELFDFGTLATTIYVLEYSALSSFFLALGEGNKKNFFVYALFLVPVSICMFFSAKIFL